MKLHSEKQIIDENYFNEVHILEKKFEESYGPLFAKRNEIVSGVYEPEELDLSSNDIIHSKDNENRPETSKSCDIKGVPGFWLKVLNNYKSISQLIQEYDEPILQNLVDIKVIRNVDPKCSPKSSVCQ
jgi:nucleosome assembly protein 1-like 1